MRQALLRFFLVTILASIVAPSTRLSAQDSTTSTDSGTITATDSALINPTPPPPPEGMAFTLSPSVLNLKTKPGENTSFQLRIRNNSTGPEALTINLTKLNINQSTLSPDLGEFPPEDPFPTWLSFEPSQFTVEPNQWQVIEGVFSPPPEALLGYYAGVTFRRQQDPQAPEGTTAISGAPTIIALFEVESTAAFPQLQLANFTGPKWVEYLPATFAVEVVNSGNIHLQPFGNIFIDQGSAKDVGILTVNDKAGFVLPGGRRVFTSSWDEGFPLIETVRNDDGSETKKVNWDFTKANWFRMGKYTATMLIAYSDGMRDIPLEASLTFWVIPWKLMLGITGILLVLAFGIVTITKTVLKTFKRDKQPVSQGRDT